jgi:hypothetical protein
MHAARFCPRIPCILVLARYNQRRCRLRMALMAQTGA